MSIGCKREKVWEGMALGRFEWIDWNTINFHAYEKYGVFSKKHQSFPKKSFATCFNSGSRRQFLHYIVPGSGKRCERGDGLPIESLVISIKKTQKEIANTPDKPQWLQVEGDGGNRSEANGVPGFTGRQAGRRRQYGVGI